MSKNVKEVISYFEKLYTNKAIYLWGANGEVITKELCDKLFKTYGSSTYNRQYYDNKLKEGTGHIGADCSGVMYPVSGFDTTAQGYYNKCSTKGSITSIPKDTSCLVFKGKSTSAINHIGFYLGNGYTIEMKSSKENCIRNKLESGGWKWYGIPNWIDYSSIPVINTSSIMLTGGTEITQNASEFGNFLKIGSMRIRGMKGELEELGEEVDETVDSISKVQTQILNRTGGKVNIFDDMGNFRDYYDIMEDISEIYNELSDPNKADLTEILFGKQRGNQGAALIQAFQSGQIQKALDATLHAEGSAMQEQELWMESLEAKTAQFEAAFQSLSSTVLDSNLLKWFVDFGTGTVKVIDTVIDEIGSLGTIGAGAGIFGIFKNVDYLKTPVCPHYI